MQVNSPKIGDDRLRDSTKGSLVTYCVIKNLALHNERSRLCYWLLEGNLYHTQEECLCLGQSWLHLILLGWKLATPKWPTMWFTVEVLGHVVSVNPETEINHRDNPSIMPTWWSSNKISGQQSSGKLPQLQYSCILSHTNVGRVTHPDSTGRGKWKLHIWNRLTAL